MVAQASPADPAILATGLHFAWGQQTVLRGLSFTLAAGEFVGLLGPNGSGKSTLLRLLAGLLMPTAGQVQMAGLTPGRETRQVLARQVAVVAQTPLLPEQFTVAEYVLLGRTPHLRPLQPEGAADYAVARQALEATELLPLAGRSLGALSGGEQQRVILARALAQEPAILLLDEPTTHLDPGVAQEMLVMLRRLNQERGLTILASLHDINLAAAFFPRLLLLHHGQIGADGAPAAVLTPTLLQRAYGYRPQVIIHPQSGLPVVLPDSGGFGSAPDEGEWRLVTDAAADSDPEPDFCTRPGDSAAGP